jgi:two-component system, LytTR family, response regulator
MPDMNGFELLMQLERQPWVVFTTAFDQYALKAFEVNSLDYLLKPIERTQLDRALGKLTALRDAQAHEDAAALIDLARSLRAGQPAYLERIPSRVGGHIRILPTRRVTHFVAEDKLTYAVVDDQRLCVDETLTSLERKLDPARFVRIHRATIVNLDFVGELHGFFAGSIVVRLKDKAGTDLSVARDRVRDLKQHLGL